MRSCFMKSVWRIKYFLFSFLVGFFLVALTATAWAQFGGGGGGSTGTQPPAPGPLPPATVQPLPSDTPVPWGTDPATLAGVKVEGIITGTGFLQETVTLQNGSSFFFQSITTPDFSAESYVKRNPNGSLSDPQGNVIFNQVIKDPAFGMTDRAFINGFKQPIQLHFDIVESKVAKLTGGFNQMDMHFRQIPFRDTATGTIRLKQDVGVWITGFAGLGPEDITEDHNFTLGAGDLNHTVAKAIPTGGGGGGGGFGGGFGGGSSPGSIDWWNDLTVVKILDANTQKLITFSRCSDFGDPTGRLEDDFESDAGRRGGCGATPSTGSGRPAIPNHDLDTFQLSPVNWDRWGGAGSGKMNSGITTVFPDGTGSNGGGGGGFGR